MRAEHTSRKLLILSDIHGNWPALEAVLQAESDFTAVAFCGDAVDYGPFPLECVHWLEEHAHFAVRGNHDNALAFNLDCRCMGSMHEYSVATRAWHKTLLGLHEIGYLGKLPTVAWFKWQGKHFRMAHATPQGDLFEYLPADQWGDRLNGIDADYVLLGHTHIQEMRQFGKITVVNPGSVGMSRDAAGEAWYAVYQAGQIRLGRVDYDVARTIAALERAPQLPRHVVDGLSRCFMGRTSTEQLVNTGVQSSC